MLLFKSSKHCTKFKSMIKGAVEACEFTIYKGMVEKWKIIPMIAPFVHLLYKPEFWYPFLYARRHWYTTYLGWSCVHVMLMLKFVYFEHRWVWRTKVIWCFEENKWRQLWGFSGNMTLFNFLFHISFRFFIFIYISYKFPQEILFFDFCSRLHLKSIIVVTLFLWLHFWYPLNYSQQLVHPQLRNIA